MGGAGAVLIRWSEEWLGRAKEWWAPLTLLSYVRLSPTPPLSLALMI